MPKRLTVVVSQGQSQNPAKRALEEAIVTALLFEPGIDVTVIPHLYDLKADGSGMLCLQGITGDMVVAAWLFPRAAHWTLDRNGIRGKVGETLLDQADEDDEDPEGEAADAEPEEKLRVIDQREAPNRTIYTLDLRQHEDAQVYVEEIKRIAASTATEVVGLMDWIGGTATPEQMGRFATPTNDAALGENGQLEKTNLSTPTSDLKQTASSNGTPAEPTRVEENAARRWYPVIDYSRCTNCMECIDFCLFGVYGVDGAETILVEQQDNCRKGCPACSRVCPENAIIFPQHKAPAIAGSSEVDAGGLKIDLSQLFGGSSDGASAEEIAARERDEQLLLAGREPVGASLPKRQADTGQTEKDDLDGLIDALDDFDL